MNTIQHTQYGETFTLYPSFGQYTNGRLAISFIAEAQGPYGHLTINLPDQHLNDGEVFVKDWSENEELVRTLTDAGWLASTGREVASGFVIPKVMVLAGPLLEAYNASKGV